ncbi:ABC transporter ATP-binding protein [candidate division CSSED10-310 bacterium]|uniref:ABC transporter ATP-binding protein n=1 Tax=candidate division CSSED10-310 bacterium TaxID=2855610 RepID=A0ABV6YW56_UNCC1
MDLSISNISKRYKNGVQALAGVDLCIKPGMFGLLGPNGAGKSTLMRIIATLLEPDGGDITFGDLDVLHEKKKVRRILGYLPQEFGTYPKITAEDMLSHFALLKGITRYRARQKVVTELLQLTNLYQDRKKTLGSFSGGMKQRFGIAQALLAKPQLLIVDEPTAGLDPEERVRFLNVLSDIGEITVVILSTHIVADVNELCSAMAVIHQGKLLLQGQPARLTQTLVGKIWQKSIEKQEQEQYQQKFNLISSRLRAGKTQISIFSEQDPDNGFKAATADLHDVYFCALRGFMN